MADDFEPPVGEPEPSLRDTLSEAFADDAGASPPQGVQPAAAIPDPNAKPAAAPSPGEPARGPDGKFIAKGPEQAQTAPQRLEPNAQAQGGPATPQTIAPPASWSATAKSKFAALDPEIQREVLKREGDIEQGKAQWDQKAERFNRLDTVLGPRREKFAIAGVSEDQALQALFAAQDLLERDPRAGLAFLAQQYRVDLRTLQPAQQGQAPQQAPMHPALAQAVQAALGPVMQEVNALKGTFSQQQAAQQQAAQAQVLQDVQAFRSDPANMYFDNVAEDMAALIQTGRAASVKDAYDMAVWANPTTRSLVAAAQQAQQAAEAATAARARSSAARYASGSVTGSPSPGSSPAGAGPAATVRDELSRAFADSA